MMVQTLRIILCSLTMRAAYQRVMNSNPSFLLVHFVTFIDSQSDICMIVCHQVAIDRQSATKKQNNNTLSMTQTS